MARTTANLHTPGVAGKLVPDAKVIVRHYCQGIGDCHLLGFPKDDGGMFWMMIDCGVHTSVSGGAATMERVVEDIAKVTNRLDVIVVTHEHTDHVSGFLTAAKRFEGITIGEAWLAWTENPGDGQARELDRYKQQALAALQLTSQCLDQATALSLHLQALQGGLDALLGLHFGATGDRVRASRDAAVTLAGGRVRYCEPRDPPIAISALPNLRIYVLGPSRDPRWLGITDRESDMYLAAAGAGGGGPFARALTGAFAAQGVVAASDEAFTTPFDADLGTELSLMAASGGNAVPPEMPPAIVAFARDHYFGPMAASNPVLRSRRRKQTVDPREYDQSWRRIDFDWLGISADLAMQLDDRTNNTSLVLAFEFTDTGRVLLFTADAQVGNWLSWQETQWDVQGKTVTGRDLLARTVHYKVGHHGSENATLKDKGLNLMTSKDLTAFIPTHEADAKKVKWGRMPYPALLQALSERCRGRVIRADDDWLRPGGQQVQPPFPVPDGAIRALYHDPAGLWVELHLA